MLRRIIIFSALLSSSLSLGASHGKAGNLPDGSPSKDRPAAKAQTSTRFFRINLGPEVPFDRFKSVLLAAEGEEPTFRIVHGSSKHNFFLVETEQTEAELKELFTEFFPGLAKHIETIRLETTLEQPEIPATKKRALFSSPFSN
ncbi:MAG: hypothetical protein EB120_07135 [Proteobacteria bacterium]|nr:hypothetical protein [Pseudomonadota bacterium]